MSPQVIGCSALQEVRLVSCLLESKLDLATCSQEIECKVGTTKNSQWKTLSPLTNEKG